MKTKLFIDGRNLIGKLEQVFEFERKPVPKWNRYNFKGLLEHVLSGIVVDETVFYFARIKQHPDTIEKSNQLIEELRLLKTHLESFGYQVVMGGTVRGHTKEIKGKNIVVFKEKGVDVSIAVDMVALACDQKVKAIILASSDSDLQPAVREIIKRNIECYYLGFEIQPNKGLTATTSRTILIRNSEVINFFDFSTNP